MSVDVLIAVAGVLVTLLVVVGMIFITPSNIERSNRAAPPDPLPDEQPAREPALGRAGFTGA